MSWLGLDGDRECIKGAREEAEKEESTQAEKRWKPPRPGGRVGGLPDRPNNRPEKAETPGDPTGGPLTAPTTAQKGQNLQVVE